METSLSWRAAHVWLRGYSDGKLGRTLDAFPEGWEPYRDHYDRAHAIGAGIAANEPALVETSCEDGQCPV